MAADYLGYSQAAGSCDLFDVGRELAFVAHRQLYCPAELFKIGQLLCEAVRQEHFAHALRRVTRRQAPSVDVYRQARERRHHVADPGNAAQLDRLGEPLDPDIGLEIKGFTEIGQHRRVTQRYQLVGAGLVVRSVSNDATG